MILLVGQNEWKTHHSLQPTSVNMHRISSALKRFACLGNYCKSTIASDATQIVLQYGMNSRINHGNPDTSQTMSNIAPWACEATS